MKVWILLERDYTYSNIIGVFSSREKAEEAMAIVKPQAGAELEIEDGFVLDEIREYWRPESG